MCIDADIQNSQLGSRWQQTKSTQLHQRSIPGGGGGYTQRKQFRCGPVVTCTFSLYLARVACFESPLTLTKQGLFLQVIKIYATRLCKHVYNVNGNC